MDKKPKSGLAQLTPEQVREITVTPPNLPLMYFNQARMVSTNFDVRVFFGITNISAKGEQSITEQLCVVFTPEFGTSFLESLKITLEKFEVSFGKIRPIPSHLLSKAEDSLVKPPKRKN